MKTISVRDDIYKRLMKLKKDGESFSDLLERLLSREEVSLRNFFGTLRDSEFLSDLENEVLEFRRKSSLRESS
ncbi:MAG TPA: antitoxin [Candidatus Bathyarchaeota archaeon]|nr:antitoxin [Candidatus Bathyarchaeota archaeon]